MPSAYLNRRQFLCLGGGCVALTALPALAVTNPLPDRAALRFHHLHTGESGSCLFWSDGRFVDDGLATINRLLRDHRSGEATLMDRRLLLLLYQLQQQLGIDATFEVISAYRSPTTNALLAARSGGVAKRSLHMLGQAIDIRIPGVALADLRTTALALRGGGVGFYPRDNFIHLDVGRVRQWG